MRVAGTVLKFSLFGLIMLTAGCGAGLQPVCRHTALMCALVMQEKYNNVEVAFGPVINANREADPLITHAQTRVMVEEKWVWVNYVGGTCQLTNQKERFLDLNHYSAGMFYAWLWKSSAPAMNAPLPTISFKDAISIKDAVIR
jgi:hypothetical protein